MTPPRRQRRRLVALLAAACVAAACGHRLGEPDGLRLGRTDVAGTTATCPPIAGTFEYADNDLAVALTRMLPWEARQRPWWTITITGSADSAMVLAMHRFDGTHDTVTVRLGNGYVCTGGWLVPPEADALFAGRAYDDDGNRANRNAFAIAIDDEGALIGRRTATTYDQFDVWCGDGCRGFPLPWTFRDHVVWSTLAPPEGTVPRTPYERDVNRRTLEESRRLEEGDPFEDAPASRRGRAARDAAARRTAERDRAIEEGLPVP
jgi:hypothetical protein